MKNIEIALPSTKILAQSLGRELKQINYKQYRLKLIKH